jgi:hypothetical protein
MTITYRAVLELASAGQMLARVSRRLTMAHPGSHPGELDPCGICEVAARTHDRVSRIADVVDQAGADGGMVRDYLWSRPVSGRGLERALRSAARLVLPCGSHPVIPEAGCWGCMVGFAAAECSGALKGSLYISQFWVTDPAAPWGVPGD